MRHSHAFVRGAEFAHPAPAARRSRVVWLAMGEGRGHLMRARLAAQLLRPHGIDVDVVTTNPESVAFMRDMGLGATLLSDTYRLAYSDRQDLSRMRTWVSGLSYLALPTRCARDIAWLTGYAHDADLVVDDSLHPTLILASCFENALTSRIVHVHGRNVRRAVEDTLGRGPFAAIVRRALAATRQIEISVGATVRDRAGTHHLPPLLHAPRDRDAVRAELGVPTGGRLAVVYLNPYFRDPALAEAIEQATREGFVVHAVAEGYAGRDGWRGCDPNLGDAIAAADVFISAAGMASLTLAHTTGVPMIALATQQPEQRKNLAEAPSTSWRRVVDLADDVPAQLAASLAALPTMHPGPTDALLAIRRSRHHWTEALLSLVDSNRKATS